MSARATVTVLFCDVVGSTALLSRLGEAANDELRRDVFAALRRAVEIHDGEEIKSQGDGLMVAFTTSASDAVACAVAMHRAVARLAARDPLLDLAIRVGVATGEATYEEDDWFGTPVVQAARLCSAARPRQVLVTDVLAAVAGDGAAFRSVGALSLKGFPEPVPASEVPWQPDDAPAAVPLPPALDTTGELPFVGRSRQLAVLTDALDRAAGGDGPQVVLVSGEAGIGKTRLLAELGFFAQRRRAVVLYGTSMAEALRWYVTSTPVPVLRRHVGDDGPVLAGLVPALRVRLPELVEAGGLGPVDHEDLAAAVTRFVARAAATTPLVLLVDDVHAADPRTLVLLTDVATAGVGPVLMVAAFRTDEGPIGGALATVVDKLDHLPGTTRLELGPLDLEAVTALVGDQAAAGILAHGGGVPRTTVALARQLTAGRSVEEVAARVAPYKGLAPLEVDDADIFFGREEAITSVLARLSDYRLVAIVGASGSGKSSLVRAGVLPALRRGALPGSARWSTAVLRPGASPNAALDEVMRDRPDLLVVDQLEEVFTLCAADDERERFVDRVVRLAADRRGDTSVIVTVRADFYGHCASFPVLVDALELGHILLGPMTADELRAAVEGPAEVAGLRLEPGLADVVVAEIAGEPGGLPLLSQAMLETWKRRRGRTLTIADYREAGGARGAIARTADTVFTTGLDGRQQALARSVLLRLTEPGQGAEDTRRRVPLHDLVPTGVTSDEVAGVVDVLADARLLTVDEGRVEVAHEALIREWPRLRSWIDDDREALHVRRHLEQAAREWEASRRETAELYRGARLETAVELIAAERLEPTTLEREFVEASVAERDRAREDAVRRVRRLRLLLVGSVAALVIALVAGAVAWQQRSTANRQRTRAEELAVQADARRLVLEASALGADQSDLAALLAVEAHRLDEGSETEGALQAALLREHRVIETLVQGEGADFIQTSGDGAVMAVSSVDRLFVLDAEGEELLSLPAAPGVGFALSGDGGTLAYVDDDGAVVAADVRTGTGTILPAPAEALELALTANGSHLAAAGPEGEVQIVAVASGEVVGRVTHGTGPVALGFSPDGDRLATFGASGDETVGIILPEGVAAVPADGTVRLWDGRSGAPLAGPVSGPRGAPTTVEFAPDGDTVAVGSSFFGAPGDLGEDEQVAIHDGATLEPTGVAVRGSTAVFDEGGDRLAVAGRDGDVTVVDPSSGRPLASSLQVELVTTLGFRGDGALVTGGAGVTAWDWAADVTLAGPRAGEPLAMPAVAGADGASFAVVTDRNLLGRSAADAITSRVVDADTFETVGAVHVGRAVGLRDGRMVLILAGGGVDIVEVDSGDVVDRGVAEGATGPSATSGDGQVVAVAVQGAVELIDIGGGGTTGRVPVPEGVADVALDRAGRRLLVATGAGELLAVDFDAGASGEVRRHDFASPVTAVAWDRDDRVLIGTDNGSILRGEDGGELLSSQSGPVIDLAAGERFVASATEDGRVRLHDVAGGEWVGDPLSTAAPGPLAFLSGHRLLTRSAAGVVAWDLDPASWPARACRAAGRQLTESEWEQYLPGRPYAPGCGQNAPG